MGATVVIVKKSANNVGAVLFNVYQFSMQMAALYASSLEYDKDGARQAQWNTCMKSVVDDMGSIFAAHERHKDKTYSDTRTLRLFAELAVLSVGRLSALEKAVNAWTSAARLPRLLRVCEKRWARVLRTLPHLEPSLTQIATVLSVRGDVRVDILLKMDAVHANERHYFAIHYARSSGLF